MLKKIIGFFKTDKSTHTVLTFDEVMIGWKAVNKQREASNYLKLEEYLKEFLFIKKI